MENFNIDIYDAATGLVLKKTTIGERIYVEAEPSREFHVTLTVKDENIHKKSNPTGFLNSKVYIDGRYIGYGKSFKNGVNSVTFKDIDGRALVFTQPEQQWFNDIEDAKRAKEENKTSKVGVIEALFFQAEKTNKKVDRTGSGGIGISTVKATKKYIDQPNVGITGGRVIATNVGKLNQIKMLYEFGKLTVHCQSALCIKMLKAQHDGVEFDADPEPEHEEVPAPAALKKEDGGGVPVIKDEAGASAAGKKRVVMEIDLTNDDSDSDSDDDDEDAPSAAAAAAEANKRAKTSSASSEEIDLDFTK